jgi:hypothetical protein
LPNNWRGQNSPPWPRRGLRFPVTILTFRLRHDTATKCEIQDVNTFLLTLHLVEMAKLQGASRHLLPEGEGLACRSPLLEIRERTYFGLSRKLADIPVAVAGLQFMFVFDVAFERL